ncbi:MAG: NADPH-dependent FMN reductase [Balneolales bacterium]
MKVAILTGSVRNERQSHKVAYYLEQQLKERSIETDLIDLRENPLPVFEDPSGQYADLPDHIRELGDRLGQADALLLVTPEYHGSFSGVMKNALDYFWSEFSKKPIGVATASAGRMGGINASTQLQHVILSLGAYPLPGKLIVPEVQNAFYDESYEPQNERIIKSTNKFLDEFIWLVEAVYQKKNPEECIPCEEAEV